LSQKVRHIRWKWNKRSASTNADEPPKKKKAPKRFLEVDILGMKLHRIECSYH